jgi:hypothetical protein
MLFRQTALLRFMITFNKHLQRNNQRIEAGARIRTAEFVLHTHTCAGLSLPVMCDVNLLKKPLCGKKPPAEEKATAKEKEIQGLP